MVSPVVKTLRELTFHPCVFIASISGLYLSFLLAMCWLVYLSRVNVNLIIQMVWDLRAHFVQIVLLECK